MGEPSVDFDQLPLTHHHTWNGWVFPRASSCCTQAVEHAAISIQSRQTVLDPGNRMHARPMAGFWHRLCFLDRAFLPTVGSAGAFVPSGPRTVQVIQRCSSRCETTIDRRGYSSNLPQSLPRMAKLFCEPRLASPRAVSNPIGSRVAIDKKPGPPA